MAVTPLRPQTLPVHVPGPSPASAARAAAQRAFFEAALGGDQVAAARKPVEAAAPASFTPHSQQRADAPAEPPTRILRPGSFIDIKV